MINESSWGVCWFRFRLEHNALWFMVKDICKHWQVNMSICHIVRYYVLRQTCNPMNQHESMIDTPAISPQITTIQCGIWIICLLIIHVVFPVRELLTCDYVALATSKSDQWSISISDYNGDVWFEMRRQTPGRSWNVIVMRRSVH